MSCRVVGLPAGVVNVVHGTVPTVNAICDHPDIKAVSFVGGDRAGRHIYERRVKGPVEYNNRYTIIADLEFRGTRNGKRVQVSFPFTK